MVVVGTDVHKRTHTFVAVDEVGRRLGEKVVKATTVGHHRALAWAREQFGEDLLWGIEDCRNLSARLERGLLTAGQSVVRVAPKLMSQTRASARTRGKSDPIDALAVAQAVLHYPDLPVAVNGLSKLTLCGFCRVDPPGLRLRSFPGADEAVARRGEGRRRGSRS